MFLIIIGTILGCGDLITPYIISLILSLTTKESSVELQLRNEIIDLKRQLQTVSMVDQFPSYAKLQRKINALTTQYKDRTTERRTGAQKAKSVLNILLNVLIGVCSLWVVWNHRSSPIVSLPADLIWPFAYVLSLPSCQLGEISVMFWIFIVRTASVRLIKIIKNESAGVVKTSSFE
ncbi:UNVERIFIED_CONTAM: hypothetical protein GTU68_011822 [Idotea baltica]|nr:hypothetical protein [Idotea baltica]